MSCVETEGKVADPQKEKVTDNDDPSVSNGKPCIDFQPDDRWQIKDEGSVSEKIPNSRVKDPKCSNGRRSQRLRNCKSNFSPALNGEADESSSDSETPVTNTVQAIVHVEEADKSENQKVRSKRKRVQPDGVINNSQNSKNSNKRMKIDGAENDIEIESDVIKQTDNSEEQNSKDSDKSDEEISCKETDELGNECIKETDTLTTQVKVEADELENECGSEAIKLEDECSSEAVKLENECSSEAVKLDDECSSVAVKLEDECSNESDKLEEECSSEAVKLEEECSTETNKLNNDTNVTSELKVTVPDSILPSLESNITLKKDGVDLDSSIEVLEEEKSDSKKIEVISKDSKVQEQSDNKSSKIEGSVDTDKKPELQNENNEIEIEIINLHDDAKDESDSEIQIINLDDKDVVNKKRKIPDFPTPPSDTDVSLSAGYPYYNSLKEKIPNFKAGDYKPVKFPHTGTLLLAENEVIIESPSLLVPLLIKESDEFPKLEGEEKKPPTTTASSSDINSSVLMRSNMISKKNFFQSSVGQFLINLGTSRVQEWYQRDMKRAKLKQLKSGKEKNTEELEKTVAFHEKRYSELKEINAIFNFRLRQCKFCNFKTESLSVMEGHCLVPHLSPRREYKCNFCVFLTRDPEQIIFHFEALHGKKAHLDTNIQLHECTFCSFEHHLKTKVNVHMNRCRKHFIPSQNLAPPFDFEFPGVTTKPVTIADVIGHRRLLLSSSKNRMPMVDDNNSAYARKKLASVLSKLAGQPTYSDIKNTNIMKQLITPQSLIPPISAGSSIQLPPGIVITRPRGQPIQQMRPINRYPPPRGIQNIRGQPPRRGPPFTTTITSAASHLASSGISITPITRTSGHIRPNSIAGVKNVTLTPIATASNRNISQKPGPPQPVALFSANSGGLLGQPQARMPLNMQLRPLRPAGPFQRLNTPPSQVVKGSSGNTFVVCEICDAYIKDLEELRTHMNWVHKVKIHPKMLVSRPPLNCQKCQWRFFTDQGLERHLLGAHGLVTTNMQEMANKNQDSGRCIICGAVFTYKLVSHMTQVHKVTLKPAHLSYKCTVCTATFTLYRLFESHVYNVHSGSAKRLAEDSPSEPPPKKIPEDVGARRCKDCNVVTENMREHLIKKHMKKCSVKLCRIEKCKKCLYSSDEMLIIRMSDFGIEDEDLDDSDESDSSDESSEPEEIKEIKTEEKETG